MNIGMASFNGVVPNNLASNSVIKPRISVRQATKSFDQLCAEIGDTPLVRHYKAIIAATDCKKCATRRAEIALQAWLTKNSN